MEGRLELVTDTLDRWVVVSTLLGGSTPEDTIKLNDIFVIHYPSSRRISFGKGQEAKNLADHVAILLNQSANFLLDTPGSVV
jgi:hypothetical protein